MNRPAAFTARCMQRMQRLTGHIAKGWNAFWFAEGPTVSLGLFRIAFAYVLWREIPVSIQRNAFAITGGFHLPYLDVIPLVSETTYRLLHTLQYPCIALLGLGLLTRPACGVLFVLQGYLFFADRINFRNHPYFFVLLLLLLLILFLAPTANALSVQAIIRAVRKRRPWWSELLGSRCPLTCQRLIQVQVSLVYVYAALHKLNPGYLGGLVMQDEIVDKLMMRLQEVLGGILSKASLQSVQAFLNQPEHLIVPSVLSVMLELTLPFALWHRRTRPFALGVGVLFHLSIAFSMYIVTFSWAVIGSYLLFLDPETLPRLWHRTVQRIRGIVHNLPLRR